jgi:hypothetical protein
MWLKCYSNFSSLSSSDFEIKDHLLKSWFKQKVTHYYIIIVFLISKLCLNRETLKMVNQRVIWVAYLVNLLRYLVEIYSVAETIIHDGFSYSENVSR